MFFEVWREVRVMVGEGYEGREMFDGELGMR